MSRTADLPLLSNDAPALADRGTRAAALARHAARAVVLLSAAATIYMLNRATRMTVACWQTDWPLQYSYAMFVQGGARKLAEYMAMVFGLAINPLAMRPLPGAGNVGNLRSVRAEHWAGHVRIGRSRLAIDGYERLPRDFNSRIRHDALVRASRNEVDPLVALGPGHTVDDQSPSAVVGTGVDDRGSTLGEYRSIVFREHNRVGFRKHLAVDAELLFSAVTLYHGNVRQIVAD